MVHLGVQPECSKFGSAESTRMERALVLTSCAAAAATAAIVIANFATHLAAATTSAGKFEVAVHSFVGLALAHDFLVRCGAGVSGTG